MGWEKKVSYFLYGAGKALLNAGAGKALTSMVAGASTLMLQGAIIYSGVKGAYWIRKNVIMPEIGLKEEEENIKKDLFVRALCADQHSIQEAQKLGGIFVFAVITARGLLHGLSSFIGEEEVEKTMYMLTAEEELEKVIQNELRKLEASAGCLEAIEELKAEEY